MRQFPRRDRGWGVRALEFLGGGAGLRSCIGEPWVKETKIGAVATSPASERTREVFGRRWTDKALVSLVVCPGMEMDL